MSYRFDDYYSGSTRYGNPDVPFQGGLNNSCSEMMRIRGGQPINGSYAFDTVLGKRWSLWPPVEKFMEEDMSGRSGGQIVSMTGKERMESPYVLGYH